jgi:formylglycine-generating enzyme required for sulfatase activity
MTLLALMIGLVVGATIYVGSQRPKLTAPVVTSSQVTVTTPPTVLDKATKEQPWQNSLGMKFVPVAETKVLFSIWDTRVQDFGAFVESAGYDATGGMWWIDKDGWTNTLPVTWKEPGFDQRPTDPVVGVSWNDATAFCKWLTDRERVSGTLPKDMHYRLPTDEEWSVAVGLGSEPGHTPAEKNYQIRRYPWGTGWPPPSGAGNYAGEEIRNTPEGRKVIKVINGVIKGYNDGYPLTSPVGSFPANKSGLYDMGGNVWQWCEDSYDSSNDSHPVRGASWRHGDADREILLASFRYGYSPDLRYADIGFRCVIAVESPR